MSEHRQVGATSFETEDRALLRRRRLAHMLGPAASLLCFVLPVHAVCLNVVPQYAVRVDANAFSLQECENSPVSLTESGASLQGPANSAGTAAPGHLSARADATFDLPQPLTDGSASYALADVSTIDHFNYFFPGPSTRARLALTFNLSGTIIATGDQSENGGRVRVVAFVEESSLGSLDQVILTAPGTAVLNVDVDIGRQSGVYFNGDLQVSAGAASPGTARAEFLDTFALSNIQLFDLNGHLLQDNVLLTDASGVVLPIAPPVAEPSIGQLLLIGLVGLFFAWGRLFGREGSQARWQARCHHMGPALLRARQHGVLEFRAKGGARSSQELQPVGPHL